MPQNGGRPDPFEQRIGESKLVLISTRFSKKVFYLFAPTAIAKIPLKPSNNGMCLKTFDKAPSRDKMPVIPRVNQLKSSTKGVF